MRSWNLKDGPGRPHGQDGPYPQPLAQPGEQPRENDNPNAVWVMAEDEAAANDAFRDWLQHLQAGRIG